MQKDFDKWNTKKKNLDAKPNSPDFHEREIWWCSIGVNVGSEQYSQTKDFSRPVLVVRKFTRDVFWGIPLTTKIKSLPFRKRYSLHGQKCDLLLLQMRVLDRKRLKRKIAVMNKPDFGTLQEEIKALF